MVTNILVFYKVAAQCHKRGLHCHRLLYLLRSDVSLLSTPCSGLNGESADASTDEEQQ